MRKIGRERESNELIISGNLSSDTVEEDRVVVPHRGEWKWVGKTNYGPII